MAIPDKVLTAAEPIALDRRADPEVRKRMSGPAMRTFFNLAERWKLSVGERRALQLSLLGSQVDAVRAKELGLIDEVVAPDALEDAVAALTAKLIAAPARAVAETKRLLRRSRHNSFEAQFNAEIEGAASCVAEEDFMEAVSAFTERRQAKFGRRP